MPYRIRAHQAVLIAVAAAALAGCMNSPASAARQAQQMNDIGDQLNDLRNQNATLEGLVDSLRLVVAKHDTSIFRLANATGVTVAK